jgi:hypothetical protein
MKTTIGNLPTTCATDRRDLLVSLYFEVCRRGYTLKPLLIIQVSRRDAGLQRAYFRPLHVNTLD